MEIRDFKPTDRLSTIIKCDYRLIQVVVRLGVTMGFADKTVSDVCHQHGVDVHTFLAVVNYARHILQPTDKKAEVSLDLIDVKSLLSYLKHTHDHILNHEMPSMRRNLLGALDCSSQNEVSFLLLKYFDMYSSEVQNHIQFEESEVYAYAESLLNGGAPISKKVAFHRHNENFVEKLNELINVFLQYYPQEGNNDALNDVVYGIYRVEQDIRIHCAIEDQMLGPLLRKLEHRRTKAMVASVDQTPNPYESSSSSSLLSDREKAVAVCVAKGQSNKEIADNLFLSVNTVTTHRRNIARKLNIHSAAGLAIYCVVNKLVKLEEINI